MKALPYLCAAIAASLFSADGAHAAVSVVFSQPFSSSTLAPGLTAVNSPTIANGVATLNGSNAPNTASGFSYVVPSFPGNYIMEAVIASTFSGASSLDAIFDAVGNENLRYKSSTALEITASDNTDNGYVSTSVGSAATLLTPGTDVALVMNSSFVAFYVNGAFVAKTSSTTIANAPTVNTLSWGFDCYTPNGGTGWRGFNGSFSAIALSTFTSDLDPTALPASAFTLVPEPSSAALLAAPTALLFRRRRR
jgi:hypothetical protein